MSHAATPLHWHGALHCLPLPSSPQVYMELMVVHHGLSMAFWPVGLLTGTAQYYVLYLLATEVRAVVDTLFCL